MSRPCPHQAVNQQIYKAYPVTWWVMHSQEILSSEYSTHVGSCVLAKVLPVSRPHSAEYAAGSGPGSPTTYRSVEVTHFIRLFIVVHGLS